jgi:hypothetical protein
MMELFCPNFAAVSLPAAKTKMPIELQRSFAGFAVRLLLAAAQWEVAPTPAVI